MFIIQQKLLHPYVSNFIQHERRYELTSGSTFPQKSVVMEQLRVSFVAVDIAALIFADRKLHIGGSTVSSIMVFF